MAASLGARYLGAIFAGGPRTVTPERAAEVFDAAGAAPLRVGVFANADVPLIESTARVAGLNVIQLHGDPTVDEIRSVQRATGCAVWGVTRIAGGTMPPAVAVLFGVADAVVLDTKVAGTLGGTGRPLPWRSLAPALDGIRGNEPVVVAGGLTAENVGEAIAALRPAVVDVSSGVESAPGIKDHRKMRDFVEAAWK